MWQSASGVQPRKGRPVAVGRQLDLLGLTPVGISEMMNGTLVPIPGSPMHRFISVITAVLLSCHMLVGCCWHHAHGGCEHTNRSVKAARDLGLATRCCSGHGHHQHMPAADEEPSPPPPAPSCDDQECKFTCMVPQRVIDAGDNWAFCALAVDALTPAHLEVVRAHQTADWHGDAGPMAPLRLHLLFSTLLI